MARVNPKWINIDTSALTIIEDEGIDKLSVKVDIDLQGGYKTVLTLAERDSIPLDKQKEGMAVYVYNEDKLYFLRTPSSVLGSDNWTVLSGTGTGGSCIVISDTEPVDKFIGLLWLNTITKLLWIYTDNGWEEFIYNSMLAGTDHNVIVNGGYF